MQLKIKSISDVITNSSSEVFVVNLSCPLYEEIKKITDFTEFPNLESVKNFILSKDYYGWDSMFDDVNEIGNPDYDSPKYDVFKDYNKTPENWEKYKNLYESLIGVAITKVNIDSDEYKRIKDVLYKDNFERTILPIIKKLIPGKKYIGDLKTGDQKVSFLWTGEKDVMVEGEKFKPFYVDINILFELIKLDTIHEN